MFGSFSLNQVCPSQEFCRIGVTNQRKGLVVCSRTNLRVTYFNCTFYSQDTFDITSLVHRNQEEQISMQDQAESVYS